MDIAYVSSLLAFTLSMSITPGPNNLMLTASGLNFGYLRTIPHILGIMFGFASLITAVALGLGAVFMQWPALHLSLKVVGAVYLLWLAWGIARAGQTKNTDTGAKPLTFLQAASFQYLNPKAWTMAITGIATFSQPGELYASSALAVVLAFAIVVYPCCTFWALVGVKVRQYMNTPWVLKGFNYTLAALTAGCVLFIVL